MEEMARGERTERSREIAEVNAMVPTLAAQHERQSGEWLFMCECGDLACHTRVLLSLREYDALKAANQPVLAKSHFVTRGEILRRTARVLVDDARALQAQAAQQLRRARRNLAR